MERELAKSFLGVGWKFPVEVDGTTGRVKTSSFEEDIAEAIRIIIMTSPGERVMNPEFGCGIQQYVFADMDYTAQVQLENEIRGALTIWEPRVTDVEVSVQKEEDTNRLLISVSYVVRSTNNPYNLVYPYFITEGA